jgi:uncharacterized protein involved in exopolysaccharide biosynthesis
MAVKRTFWGSGSTLADEVENVSPVSVETKRPRRRIRLILTLALSGALGGFLVSYILPPRYTSTATVLVVGQKIPDAYVIPIITSDFAQRVQTLTQEILSPSKLKTMMLALETADPAEFKVADRDRTISQIQSNMQVAPVITAMSTAIGAEAQNSSATDTKTINASSEPIPGFYVAYYDRDPVRSQKICNALTELMVDENLRSRSDVATSTVEFLSRQVGDARDTLVELGIKLAALKSRSPRSPKEEAKYKMLTLDYDGAEALYKDLLAKKNSAELSASMENQQLGEQMYLAATASLPDAPDFPDRSSIALWGLGIGLMLGIGRALWPARKAKTEPRAAILGSDSTAPPERQVSDSQ